MLASSSSATAAAIFIRRAGRPTGAFLARPVLSQARRNISVGAKIPAVQLKEVRAFVRFSGEWFKSPPFARAGVSLSSLSERRASGLGFGRIEGGTDVAREPGAG